MRSPTLLEGLDPYLGVNLGKAAQIVLVAGENLRTSHSLSHDQKPAGGSAMLLTSLRHRTEEIPSRGFFAEQHYDDPAAEIAVHAYLDLDYEDADEGSGVTSSVTCSQISSRAARMRSSPISSSGIGMSSPDWP